MSSYPVTAKTIPASRTDLLLPAAWGTAMKRPQISLRLMMLLVALAATVIGWRTAVEQVRRENRKGERESLQLNISELEKYIDRWKQTLDQPNSRWSHAEAMEAIKMFEGQIAEAKKRIDDLSK